MTQIFWWLADSFSRLLEPGERDAAFGDFAESGETGIQALCDVLGLVARRQTLLWMRWQSWLIFAAVILPLAMLLSVVSRSTSNVSAIYLWMYANNWGWELTKYPGFWRVMGESAESVALWYLTLACCAWTCGFVLGSVSRGMGRIDGVVLCLTLLFGELFGAPRYFSLVEDRLHRVVSVPALPDGNAVVFAVMFYRVMLPLIVQAVLVAIPALWGMRQADNATKLAPWLRIIMWAAAVATLTGMVIGEREFWVFLGPGVLARTWIWLGQLTHILWFVVFWPIAYLAANAIGQHRQKPAPI
jgi:hypothetical protein